MSDSIKNDRHPDVWSFRAEADLLTYADLITLFRDPPQEYAPVDCWWWEAGALNEDRMRIQLEEYKEQGIGGTFYYPRFLLGEEHGSDPAYWSDQWWHFMDYSMAEHKKIGLKAWLSDWSWFQFTQDQLRADTMRQSELLGHGLAIHQETINARSAADNATIAIPDGAELLAAGAYEVNESTGAVDPSSWREVGNRMSRTIRFLMVGGMVVLKRCFHHERAEYIPTPSRGKRNERSQPVGEVSHACTEYRPALTKRARRSAGRIGTCHCRTFCRESGGIAPAPPLSLPPSRTGRYRSAGSEHRSSCGIFERPRGDQRFPHRLIHRQVSSSGSRAKGPTTVRPDPMRSRAAMT